MLVYASRQSGEGKNRNGRIVKDNFTGRKFFFLCSVCGSAPTEDKTEPDIRYDSWKEEKRRIRHTAS